MYLFRSHVQPATNFVPHVTKNSSPEPFLYQFYTYVTHTLICYECTFVIPYSTNTQQSPNHEKSIEIILMFISHQYFFSFISILLLSFSPTSESQHDLFLSVLFISATYFFLVGSRMAVIYHIYMA